MSTEVIIIGGGHNGLVCASYLAKAGLRVKVIEKNEGFLIFGLQRTGSNVLSEMLKRSFLSTNNTSFNLDFEYSHLY